MEALYTWMADRGLDPATLPWIAGVVLVVLVLVIAQASKRRTQRLEQQAEAQRRIEAAEAERLTAEANREAEQARSAEAAKQAEARQQAEQEAAAAQAAQEAEMARKQAAEAAARQAEDEARAAAVAEAERVAAEQEQAKQRAEQQAEQQRQVEAERQAAAEQAAREAQAEAEARARAEAQALAEAQAEADRQAEAAQAAREAQAEAERQQAAEEAARLAQAEAEAARLAEEAERQAAAAAKTAAEAPEQQKKRLFDRIKTGLSRTKANLTEQLSDLFLGAKEIDEDLLEEIETTLLMADIGVEATTEIIERLTDRVERKQLKDADALKDALKQELGDLLGGVEHPLQLPEKKPAVILMVGVNGVGKTTTIGKLAKKYQTEGKSVMLAAGDTFRAAAVEQLQVWGERNNVPVVAQHTGADSASVIFDALQSAQSKGVDVLIADTAGRLQNKDNLMQELQKVVRVMQKLDPDAPHEVMLVLDAGTGQNAISQAKQFKESVGVTGITLTKLDGTAKGGIIFAIAKQFGLPIRFIGVGEQVDDLRPFEADEFVHALFD
jgi:fused signal recognition particle receptor